MTLTIEIQASTQPGLIYGLNKCINQLKQGLTHINSSSSETKLVKMSMNEPDVKEFHDLYAASHPKPTADWTD